MSDEPDFATFKKAPLEAYKTLFEKFLKAKGDNEKVRGRYLASILSVRPITDVVTWRNVIETKDQSAQKF